MTKNRILALAGIVMALALVASLFTTGVLRAAPPKDTLAVTADTSTPLGVTPTTTPPDWDWDYAYCITSGAALSDTLPIEIAVNNTNATSGDSYTITMSVVGPLASFISLPSDFSLTDDGTPVTKNISLSIPGGTFTTGNHTGLVTITTTTGGQLVGAPVHIHIVVSVGTSCAAPPASSCFLTDSEFNDLVDCSANFVSDNTGGTFQIVPNNKKIIVSTNPGQFYYNLIWANTTGGEVTVEIDLSATHLVPTGANSVHAFTFNSSGFTQNESNFDMVNQNGTPCGPFGPCTITVADGDILWVTWHLQYSFIGQSTTGLGLPTTCSGSCSPSDNNYIAAGATLTNTGDSTILTTCTATACGYLKH